MHSSAIRKNKKLFNLRFYLKFFQIPFVVLTFIFSTSFASAKDYSIKSVAIDAHLDSDGSMKLIEKRTYKFEGHFRWASYYLPTENTGGIVDFSLSEENKPYLRSNVEKEGIYQYIESPNLIQVNWYYDAENEERTFIISYRILNVVRLYEDAAVLYYKFIGTGWDKPSEEVKVTLLPPEYIDRKKVRAWVHGPLWGKIDISDQGEIKADVQKLPANTYWEVRALYPPDLFPRIKTALPQKVVANILEEEKTWADDSNRKREEWLKKTETERTRKRYGALLVTGLSGIGIFICLNLYNRYGRKHKVPFPETLYSEIPSDTPPALLSYLLFSEQITAGALVGTMLDLAHKGFLKIQEKLEIKKSIFGSHKSRQYFLELNRDFYAENRMALQGFEQSLLDIIFNELSEGKDALDFKTLRKSRNKFIKWFAQWQKEIKKIGQSKGYWERESLSAINKSLLVSGILLFITIISSIYIGVWALIPALVTVGLFVLSFFIPRRRPEYELEAKKWFALKKYLAKYHFRETNRGFQYENIGNYLVYGVVLGLSREVIKKMAELIPKEEYNRVIPWYIYGGDYSDLSPAGFAESLSSLMSTAAATMSSATGTGGGASGGGGGGAGGSGGGAG
ncbi:MAG: DUF2207 domain-containing protein [candidate division Zixibacteria bacterium]|nr:DUF2207 domain-containing protein [candidate division Zixibacteria bacterium]